MKRALFLPVLFCGLAAAQPPKTTLNIWPGAAPGSETWKQQEAALGPSGNQRVVNVVTPTLTVYLPEPARANGTGVVIAPGGGFQFLTIDSEGHDVARWLTERGFAAFVLKYRVAETPGQDPAELMKNSTSLVMGAIRGSSPIEDRGKPGIADGIQAVKVVRQRAAEWGVAPNRIVLTGFSAGAMVTCAALLQPDVAARPDYAAPIYGAPFGDLPPIPQGLPPVFLAFAQDDTLVAGRVMRFYDALKSTKYAPELHIFASGGHGFGMNKQGKSSDHWIDAFYFWLEAHGLTRRAKAP